MVRRVAAMIVVGGIIAALASLTPIRFAVALLASGDVATLRSWILGFGAWAPMASAATGARRLRSGSE